ncbi:MAG: hypothetical protein SFU85_02405 [Candidatus Methylacidiphilales bacterium]|nr:hypothetical protein [Candidatus Methylacidiphilales bacterium]
MPIYSLVALLLSLFGATYTVLNVLRTASEKRLKDEYESADVKLASIKKNSGTGQTSALAEKYTHSIKRNYAAWKYIHLLPLGYFCLAITCISVVSFFHWQDVVTPSTARAVDTAANSGTPAPATNNMDMGIICERARWMLLAALLINFFSAGATGWCWYRVLSCGGALKNLNNSTEETMQAQQYVAGSSAPSSPA